MVTAFESIFGSQPKGHFVLRNICFTEQNNVTYASVIFFFCLVSTYRFLHLVDIWEA